MSGIILGPPNYHDYQNQLRKLHAERFSRMPFDAFKARVKIVKDEAVVKKWIEDQSFKTEYTCLNVPEPLKLASMEEVEKHFRATHKETIIKSVETMIVDGVKSRNLRNRELQRLVRAEWDNQMHFPLQLATALSKQFSSYGLQFFKVNKTVVHVSVARPQFLDLVATPVSENIKRIVEFVNANPRCTRRKLFEALAPSPKAEAPAAASTPAPAAAPVEGQTPAPAAEGESTARPAGASAQPQPTPEQTALIADLHWLIHQGHVLEFSDNRLETAKKPLPRPAKPEKKADQTPATPAAETSEEAAIPADASAEASAEPTTAEFAEEKPAEAVAAEPAQPETPSPEAHQTPPAEEVTPQS